LYWLLVGSAVAGLRDSFPEAAAWRLILKKPGGIKNDK